MTEITIAMPSHNRGHRALESMQWMAERLPYVRLLVVDNGSDPDDSYDVLRLWDRVEYVRHDENEGFVGSFTACIQAVTEGVVVVVSDEDVVPPAGLKALLGVDWEKVSTARGSIGVLNGATPHDSIKLDNEQLSRGHDAIIRWAFRNRYISGTAYNMDKVSKVMPAYLKSIHKHEWYPHMYLDTLACTVGDLVLLKSNTCLQGREEETGGYKQPSQYGTQYSWGSRMDQHVVMRDALIEACPTGESFAQCYVQLSFETMRMVGWVNSRMYQDEAHIDVIRELEAAKQFCLACVTLVDRAKPHLTSITGHISQAHKQIEGALQPSGLVPWHAKQTA